MRHDGPVLVSQITLGHTNPDRDHFLSSARLTGTGWPRRPERLERRSRGQDSQRKNSKPHAPPWNPTRAHRCLVLSYPTRGLCLFGRTASPSLFRSQMEHGVSQKAHQLGFQILEAPEFGNCPAAMLGLPLVERRARPAVLAARCRDFHPGRIFQQDPDNPLFRKS